MDNIDLGVKLQWKIFSFFEIRKSSPFKRILFCSTIKKSVFILWNWWYCGTWRSDISGNFLNLNCRRDIFCYNLRIFILGFTAFWSITEILICYFLQFFRIITIVTRHIRIIQKISLLNFISSKKMSIVVQL